MGGRGAGAGEEGTKRMELGSSHWCQPLGHRQKLMHRKSLLNMMINFTVRAIMQRNRLSSEVVE